MKISAFGEGEGGGMKAWAGGRCYHAPSPLRYLELESQTNIRSFEMERERQHSHNL
jgi:hypothetical protein